MTDKPIVILYAEDPGAANIVAPLPEPLRRLGLRPRLCAEGAAARQLSALRVAFEPAQTLDDEIDGAAALVVGTSENTESRAHRLVAAARAAGVPSIGAVDGSLGTADKFWADARAPLGRAPDWILVPDEDAGAAFVALGHDPARVVEVGNPHFDWVQEEAARLATVGRDRLRRRHFPDAPANRPVVAFLSELSDGMDTAEFRRSSDYTLTGWCDDDRRTHVVLQEALDALGGMSPRPYTVLRLHPKDAPESYARYATLVDRISRHEPAVEIVYAADLVIGMTTVLLAEAALLGRPVLSVLPRAKERAWLSAELREQITVVTERCGLLPAIQRLLGSQIAPARVNARAAERAAVAIARATGHVAVGAEPC